VEVVSGKFEKVAVIGANPIGGSDMLTSPPYEFTMRIPDIIRPNKYHLTPEGFTATGPVFSSEPINLLVELADTPVRLKVQPSILEIRIGGQGYIMPLGVFPDGLSVNLANSTETSFQSSAPGVATVDHEGTVNPVAPGSAKISVTYRQYTAAIPVTVLPKRQ
jgi:hypothetical protein